MLQKKSSNGGFMNKVMPYNIKKAYLMILLAMGLGAATTSCEKDDPQPKHHNTTYTFNPDDYSQINPTDKIRASADSVLVDTVFLKVMDGTDAAWASRSINGVITYQLGPAFAVSNKVYGKGAFNKVSTDTETLHYLSAENELWLKQRGYVVNRQQ